MTEYYEVKVNTSLGDYDGIIKLDRNEDDVSGVFEIFGCPSEFEGKEDKEGNISFGGKLESEVISSQYSVRGIIDEGRFHGVLNADGKSYEIKPSRKKVNPDKLTEFGSVFKSDSPLAEEIDVDGANNT